MSDITKSDVVSWLREQARRHRLISEKYLAAAEEAETAEGDVSKETTEVVVNRTRTQREPLSVEAVGRYLSSGAKRRPEIVRTFGVQDALLDEILTPDNGFHRGNRGWWTYRGNGT